MRPPVRPGLVRGGVGGVTAGRERERLAAVIDAQLMRTRLLSRPPIPEGRQAILAAVDAYAAARVAYAMGERGATVFPRGPAAIPGMDDAGVPVTVEAAGACDGCTCCTAGGCRPDLCGEDGYGHFSCPCTDGGR